MLLQSIPHRKLLDKIDKAAKRLDKTLGRPGGKGRTEDARQRRCGIGSMKSLLFADDGIVSKVRNQLAMKEKAANGDGGLERHRPHAGGKGQKDHGHGKGRAGAVDHRREQDDPL